MFWKVHRLIHKCALRSPLYWKISISFEKDKWVTMLHKFSLHSEIILWMLARENDSATFCIIPSENRTGMTCWAAAWPLKLNLDTCNNLTISCTFVYYNLLPNSVHSFNPWCKYVSMSLVSISNSGGGCMCMEICITWISFFDSYLVQEFS